MKLTVLVDNNTIIDRYFLGEPALSFLIEDGEARVLLMQAIRTPLCRMQQSSASILRVPRRLCSPMGTTTTRAAAGALCPR